MERLDVNYPFTNIPIKEIIDICTITPFEDTEKVEVL